MRVFVPIIVRGEEHLGTKLFEFGALIYKQLLGIAADEDYGDFTDITDGRDITIEGVEEVVMGKKSIKCTVIVKPKTTPITQDATLLEKLLNEQTDILAINRKYTFDQLKAILQDFLNPEGETEGEEDEKAESDVEEEKEELKEDLPKEFYEEKEVVVEVESKKPTKGAKKATSADKFEALFNN